MLRSFLVIIFLTSLSFGQELKRDEDATIFPLRVSKLNSEARLMRLKITFMIGEMKLIIVKQLMQK